MAADRTAARDRMRAAVLAADAVGIRVAMREEEDAIAYLRYLRGVEAPHVRPIGRVLLIGGVGHEPRPGFIYLTPHAFRGRGPDDGALQWMLAGIIETVTLAIMHAHGMPGLHLLVMAHGGKIIPSIWPMPPALTRAAGD